RVSFSTLFRSGRGGPVPAAVVAARAAEAAAAGAAAVDRRGADPRVPGAGAVGAGAWRCGQNRVAGLHDAVLGGRSGLAGAARAADAGAGGRGGGRVRRPVAGAGTVGGAGAPGKFVAGDRRRPVLGDRHGAEQAPVPAGAGDDPVAERVADGGGRGGAGGG